MQKSNSVQHSAVKVTYSPDLAVHGSLPSTISTLLGKIFSSYVASKEQAGEQALNIACLYDVKSSFLDPLVFAKGQREVQLQFYSLPRVSSQCDVELLAAHVETGSAKTLKVTVQNKQTMTVNILGKASIVLLDVTTELTLRSSDFKVIAHQDTWKGSAMNMSPRWLRRSNAVLINSMMRLFGCERNLKAQLAIAVAAGSTKL